MTLDRTWPATVCLFLAAYPSFGVERAELVSLSTVSGEEYRALRDRIVNEGPDALPVLDEMMGNETESWKVRLVSGVCAERIRCRDAFRVVEQANWSDVLRADPRWPYTAAGYQREIVPLYHRWLEQHGLWYYGLERYSEWDGRTRAGLERTLDSFVLDRSRGIHRWFAAKIAEEFARDYLDGRNPYCGIEVDRLRRFVLDGTLSSGAFVFLDHASDDRRTSAGTIAEFLPFVDDRSYLVKLAERCQEMESKNGIIRKRIENLDALASTNETRTILCSLAVSNSFGGVADQLARTPSTPIEKWSKIRDAILASGMASTGELSRAVCDCSLDWRKRFMANVCLEQLSNPAARDRFLKSPLQDDPERDPSWIGTAAGYAFEEIPLFRKRLCETHFWFLGLEVFALMRNEQYINPVWDTIGSALFEDAPADIRWYAARIAEIHSRNYYDGINPYLGRYVKWLKKYVADGTYPEGSGFLLTRLDLEKCYDLKEVKAIIRQTNDPELLKSAVRRLETSRSWIRECIEDRIQEIEAGTNSVEMASGKVASGASTENAAEHGDESTGRPWKRLPPGDLFRGRDTAPAPPAESR